MTKVQAFTELAEQATLRLTETPAAWQQFLTAAARFYKYDFEDTVLIYTQRPDAIACATYDEWNQRLGRRINRGAHGIALIDRGRGNDHPRLRHVFDVADTSATRQTVPPRIWRVRQRDHQTLSDAMSTVLEISIIPVQQQLKSFCEHTVKANFDDYAPLLLDLVPGSTLESEDAISDILLHFLSASVTFTVLTRCGFDANAWLDEDAFACIHLLDTYNTISGLGILTNRISRAVIQRIAQLLRSAVNGAEKKSERKPSPETAQKGPTIRKTTQEETVSQGVTVSQGETASQGETPEQLSFLSDEVEAAPSAPQEDAPLLPPPSPARKAKAAVGTLHPEQTERYDYRITTDNLGVGTPGEKYTRNTAAIRLLHQLEYEQRLATPDEQHTLSQYVGWGGLADCFDERSSHYDELKSLLSPDEYASARASTLNAHYTTPVVIRAIYAALSNMGFTSGNILEPSCGTGNFFGCLPESMSASRLYGVELDSISGRIAQQLYQNARIRIAGYETTNERDFYDVAVGNVPFGQYQVNDKAYNRLGFSIHNYFFAKAIDQVRAGGIIAFVTSRYTMDAKDSTVRRYIAQRADLLGAIRLPNNAFRANAGTDVVSDIIFLQKREAPNPVAPDWTEATQTDEGFTLNRYYIDHPDMMLGKPTSESTQYGRQDFTLEPIDGVALADLLAAAVQNIHGTYTAAPPAAGRAVL